MNKIKLKVPKGTRRLTQWENLDKLLPITGKFIVNKLLTGCGFTYKFLVDDNPVILLSPRLELIHSKEHLQNVFYFKNSNKAERIAKIKQSLYNYLMQSSVNPYALLEKELILKPVIPKIMVTYDSVGFLLDYLKELNMLQGFTVIVDEFQCLLTDSAFKANTELNTLHQLMNLDNRVILVSATPFSDDYLEKIPFFSNMDYYQMEWNASDKEDVTIKYLATSRTPREIVAEIIQKYRDTGYFNAKIVDGKEIYSKEAYIYLNKVTDICSIVEDNKLKPTEVSVVCANNERNRHKLKAVGLKIEHFNSYDDRVKNKPITFITKASFEGADLYSDNGTTFIFSNPNQKTLALDLSIDITQIVGRNRITSNPFSKDIIFYFRTYTGAIGNVIPALQDGDKYLQKLDDKVRETDRLLKIHQSTDQSTLKLIKAGQDKNGFTDNYLDVIEENGILKPTFNILAYSNDLRAYDVFTKMYKTKLQVVKQLDDVGFKIENNPVVVDLADELNVRGKFEDKMKYYIDYVREHKESLKDIQASILIPFNLNKYYATLGEDRIKAVGYHESEIVKELNYRQEQNTIKEGILRYFHKGQRIPYKEAKALLKKIYQELGIQKAPKASDIGKYIPVRTTKITVANGKRKEGIEIL